ncbi:MAG: class I SAM-dependent methyltransferase [Solirubrobacteraceae bacterium]
MRDRFEFGANWARFLGVVDERRIAEACLSLEKMLGPGSLRDRTILDAGSGSGLFSLAAMRLGAARVHSFDYDPASVACAQELQRRYRPDDSRWTIAQGSILDRSHLASLGTFDLVYSWGVLHHTGDLWAAIDNVVGLVAVDGRLFISIYNDQGRPSERWRQVKRFYNRLPSGLRGLYVLLVMAPRELGTAAWLTLKGHPGAYLRAWAEYKRERGMSRWHDMVDWVGGYPFEVATPEQVFEFVSQRGFTLSKLMTRQGVGCNEFVFTATGGARGARDDWSLVGAQS